MAPVACFYKTTARKGMYVSLRTKMTAGKTSVAQTHQIRLACLVIDGVDECLAIMAINNA